VNNSDAAAPLIAGVGAAVAPVAGPYYETVNCGMLIGQRGAAEYEGYLDVRHPHRRRSCDLML
jgi:hypothetical protein